MTQCRLNRSKQSILISGVIYVFCFWMQVSKIDANEVQRQLEGELLESLEEKFESMQSTRVPVENIPAFLTYMRKSFDGNTYLYQS